RACCWGRGWSTKSPTWWIRNSPWSQKFASATSARRAVDFWFSPVVGACLHAISRAERHKKIACEQAPTTDNWNDIEIKSGTHDPGLHDSPGGNTICLQSRYDP